MKIERVRSPALNRAVEERIEVKSGLDNNLWLIIQRLKADARA